MKPKDLHENEATRLAHYVADALTLRRRLAGWESDSRYIAEGGRVIYSVDADVVSLYLNPVEISAPLRHGATVREGYTQIFRYDESYTAAALADAVCEAIFDPAEERAIGTVVLPSIQQELNDIFHALLQNVHGIQQREVRRLHLDEELKASLASAELSADEKYEILRHELPGIAAHLLDDAGPHVELRRLHQLSRHSKLMELSRFVATHARRTPELRDLGVGDRLYDWLLFAKARQAVFSSLSDHGGRRKAASRDAEAIAKLAVMNRRMAQHSIRIVHVTGARSLFAATESMPADVGLDSDLVDATGTNMSFADMFLRHPSSFLAAPNLAFPAQSSEAAVGGEQGLIAWLDVFLTEFRGDSEPAHRALIAKAARALERDPRALAAFEGTWKAFVEPMVLKRLAVAEQRRLLATDEDVLSNLRERIEEEFDQTWARCLETATATGYTFTRSRESSAGPPRDVPLVWFDCESAADAALAEIQQSLSRQGVQHSDDLSPDYNESIAKLRDLDETGYFYFVVFAVLFASANRWKTALILAEQAIGIADLVGETTEHQDKVSGREAYYVASIAKRNVSASWADFDVSRAHLESAHRSLLQDQRNQKLHPCEGDAELSSLRFEAEEMALELAEYLFNRFVEPEPSRPRLNWADFSLRMDGLIGRLDEEWDARIRKSLQRRLLVNLLTRFLHDPEWRGAAKVRPAIAGALRERLRELVTGYGSTPGHDNALRLPVSYLHRAVTLAATSILEPPPTRTARRDLKQRAQAHFRSRNLEQNLVTAYDRDRYGELMRLCYTDQA